MGAKADNAALPRNHTFLGVFIVFAAAITVYALTAYPTVTWWDSGSYSAAALVLGIVTPPGSLLLIILGWIATQLPTGVEPGYILNLLTGLIGALAASLIVQVGVRAWRDSAPGNDANERQVSLGFALGAAISVLGYAFAVTTWRHAIKFNPYILTTVFTAVILYVFLRWWEDAERDSSWRWLLLIGFLLGLDFSVHRTNLLLAPGLIVWVAIRRPRVLLSWRSWIGGLAGGLAGLSFHLLHLPMAARDPFINMGDPNTFTRFYEYVSLKQYGGSWLLSIWERKASLFSYQTLDVFRTLRDNFFWTAGSLRVLGLFSGCLGLIGFFVLLRRRTRLAVAYLSVWIITAICTIGYFNIPENFFRPLDRHYMPLMVMFAVLMAIGGGSVLHQVWQLRHRFSRYPIALVFLLVCLSPLGQLFKNWTPLDGSNRYFAYDYAHNALAGLPPDAIVFSNGDNDTWPMLYVQLADGFRPDVHLVNLALSNTSWYLAQRSLVDPEYPVQYSDSSIAALRFSVWSDTTVTLPTPPGFATPDVNGSDTLMSTIALRLPPTIADKYARTQDLALLDLLTANNWKRPICFFSTVSSQNSQWVADHVRLDGLHYTFVPDFDPAPRQDILTDNLISTYSYRGYSDHAVVLDDVSRQMGLNYYPLFMELYGALDEAGALPACRPLHDHLLTSLPTERLDPPEDMREAILDACTPPAQMLEE